VDYNQMKSSVKKSSGWTKSWDYP